VGFRCDITSPLQAPALSVVSAVSEGPYGSSMPLPRNLSICVLRKSCKKPTFEGLPSNGSAMTDRHPIFGGLPGRSTGTTLPPVLELISRLRRKQRHARSPPSSSIATGRHRHPDRRAPCAGRRAAQRACPECVRSAAAAEEGMNMGFGTPEFIHQTKLTIKQSIFRCSFLAKQQVRCVRSGPSRRPEA
jgi:hypothetical protein